MDSHTKIKGERAVEFDWVHTMWVEVDTSHHACTAEIASPHPL
jgi:hypothetical protein